MRTDLHRTDPDAASCLGEGSVTGHRRRPPFRRPAVALSSTRCYLVAVLGRAGCGDKLSSNSWDRAPSCLRHGARRNASGVRDCMKMASASARTTTSTSFRGSKVGSPRRSRAHANCGELSKTGKSSAGSRSALPTTSACTASDASGTGSAHPPEDEAWPPRSLARSCVTLNCWV